MKKLLLLLLIVVNTLALLNAQDSCDSCLYIIEKKQGKEDLRNEICRLMEDTCSLNKEIINLKLEIESIKSNNRRQVDSLENVIIEREKALSNEIVKEFGNYFRNTNDYFCWAVMESPFYYKYDSLRVRCSLETAKLMGYDQKNNEDLNKKYGCYAYEIYHVILENYKFYTDELIETINKVIKEIDRTPRKNLKLIFEENLNKSQYYRVRHTDRGGIREAIFLEDCIAKCLKLFDDEKKFTKKNFEEVRDSLAY